MEHNNLILCFPVINKKIVFNKILEISPYVQRGDYVLTKSYNKIATLYPRVSIDSTVFKSGPMFLPRRNNKQFSSRKRLEASNCILFNKDFPIDIVYTWLDSTDKKWINEYTKFSKSNSLANIRDASSVRYSSFDELKYSLRSLFMNFSFYNHIYIVTYGHKPSWIKEHNKISFINHNEIFEKDKLPLFNSRAIECNLHKIKDISKYFLYINDDVLFNEDTSFLNFFYCNGITKFFPRLTPSAYFLTAEDINHTAWRNAAINGSNLIINKTGYSANIHMQHVPHAVNRDVMYEMEEKFFDRFEITRANKFRANTDISPIAHLYPYYAFSCGMAIPSSIKCETIQLDQELAEVKLAKALNNQSTKILCINDFDKNLSDSKQITHLLEKKYPFKAPWEK